MELTYLELQRPLWVLEVLELADAAGDVPAE